MTDIIPLFTKVPPLLPSHQIHDVSAILIAASKDK